MTDPLRLRDEGGPAKQLVERLSAIEPPAGHEERVLAAVLARTMSAAAPPPRPRALRYALIGLACVGTLLFGARIWRGEGGTSAHDATPTPPSSVALFFVDASTTAVATTPPGPATVDASTIATPTPAPSHARGPAPRPSAEVVEDTETASELQEESALIARARGELRAGDATAAQVTLDEAKRKFPSGVLAQEREALTIEAVLRSGKADEARAMADAFDARYPSSPHTARLRRMLAQ